MKLRMIGICVAALTVACSRERDKPELVTLDTGRAGQHDDQVFSPDGKRLAFTRRERDEEGLWVANADGRNARLVSQLAQQMGHPTWAPDGGSLAYMVQGVGLFTVVVEGGNPVPLTTQNARGPQYSPDGSRILFLAGAGDGEGPRLWTIATSGGAASVLATGPLGAERKQWSPDGSRIAFTAAHGDSGFVAVFDVARGTVTRLTTEGAEFFQEWSPDGRELVYISERTGQEDIWVVPAAGGAPRQLTQDVRDESGPRYSPDGKWIAYNSQRGGQGDVWIVPVAGGHSLQVTSDRAEAGALSWTRDGHGLVYVNYDAVTHIFTAPTSGGTLRQVTTGDQGSYFPDVSPDGKTLVFEGSRDPLAGIWLLPIAGGAERPLATGADNYDSRWSPDGRMVAFVSERDGEEGVFVLTIADGTERRVSPAGAAAFSPRWSPDGARILYRTAGNIIMVVAATGGDPVRVTDVGGGDVRWSPDGASIVFTHGNPRDNPGIYVAPSAGGNATPLTPDQPRANSPAWSSDGRWIAYMAPTPDGNADIFVIAADGTGRRRLTSSSEEEEDPAWSAGDTEVFFTTGYFGVSAVSPATGAVRSVFTGDLRLNGSPVFSGDRSLLAVSAFRNANVLVRVDVRGLIRKK